MSPYITPIKSEEEKLLGRLLGKNILQKDSSTTGNTSTNVMQNSTMYDERSTDRGSGTAKGSLWQRFSSSLAAAMVIANAAPKDTKLATITKRIYSLMIPISPARQYVSALVEVGTNSMYSNGAIIRQMNIYTMISTRAFYAHPRQTTWTKEHNTMLRSRYVRDKVVSPSNGTSCVSRPSQFIIFSCVVLNLQESCLEKLAFYVKTLLDCSFLLKSSVDILSALLLFLFFR